jgi:formate/nitrite transporter FocA (FNT family)
MKIKKEYFENCIKNCNTLLSSILAGVCISIGCIVNLMVGGGVIGAVLFTFGLITVVHYKYALYTGTAGFVKNFVDVFDLFFIIFVCNFIGCTLTSYAACYAIPDLHDKCNALMELRTHYNIWQTFIRAIFCGFLMTTAVKFARENRWLPLLFAVPVFILAGFYHSIADAFYLQSSDYASQLGYNYLMTIFGNFVGCNLYRLKFLDN